MTKPGASEWFSAGELAELGLPGLPSTKMGVLGRAKAEGWEARTCDVRGALARKRKARGGGVEYHVSLLPEAAQAKLMLAALERVQAQRPDRESAWLRWELLPQGYKDEAMRRLDIVDRVEGLIRRGVRKTVAIDEVVCQAVRDARREGEEPSLSTSTLNGWFARIAGVEPQDRCVFLAPDYQGRTATVDCSPEAYEHYKGYYLRQALASHASAYRDTLRAGLDLGWTIPSAKTLKRKLEREIKPSAMAYLRHGDAALDESFPHRTRDKSAIEVMQILNLDGHTWDNEVIWPDGSKGRPVSLAVQDVKSGKFLGIRFDRTLNHHLVRLALGDTFREHGLCETMLMDNGRENTAIAISGGQKRRRTKARPEDEFSGILKLLGIKAQFASPYLGRAKPIERGFRNFAHDIAKRPEFEGAYTGHNPISRPENFGSRVLPFAEFEAIVRREIGFYNAQLGRRGQGMNGKSFDQVFAEGIARNPPRRVTEQQLRLCMLASKEVTMHPKTGAVTVDDHRYWSVALSEHKRQRVVVRFDPGAMDQPVHVYSRDGRLLAQAERVAIGRWDNHADGRDARKDIRDLAKATKAVAKAQRSLSHRDVAARSAQAAGLPDTPPPAANVHRHDFKLPRTAEQLGTVAAAHPNHRANFRAGIAGALGRR